MAFKRNRGKMMDKLSKAGVSQNYSKATFGLINFEIGVERFGLGDVAFMCPHCREMSQGEPMVEKQRARLLGVLTIKRIENSFVCCHQCQCKFYSSLPAEEMYGCDAKELRAALHYATGKFGTFMAVLAVLFFALPLMGFIVGVAAMIYNWRRGGWRLKCGVIVTGIQVLGFVAYVVYIELGGTYFD